MQTALYLAALLCFLVGVAHSYLGERFILARLLGSDEFPKIFRNPDFIKATIRFAWHLTTLAWWGFAVLIVLIARGPGSFNAGNAGLLIGSMFLLNFAVALIASRGKHLAWILFLAIGVLVIWATRV